MQYIASKPEMVCIGPDYFDAVTYIDAGPDGEWKITLSKNSETGEYHRTDEYAHNAEDGFDESRTAIPSDVMAAFDLVRPVMVELIERVQKETCAAGNLKPFTVVGYYTESGKVFCEHIQAHSKTHAFFVSASAADDEKSFVCCIAGHAKDGAFEIEFPGESVVDSETVLEQQDVFAA